jgi:hypothetical protein
LRSLRATTDEALQQLKGRMEVRGRPCHSAEPLNERVCHPTSGQGNLTLTPEGGMHMVLHKDKVEIGNSE